MVDNPKWLKEMDKAWYGLMVSLAEIKRQSQQIGGMHFSADEFGKGLLTPDMTKVGWVRVQGGGLSSQAFPSGRLKLVPVLRRGEISITSNEMRQRALEVNANFGQYLGGYLLTHKGGVHRRLRIGRRYKRIFLPQDVWRDRDGYLCIPYLGRLPLVDWCEDLFGWSPSEWRMSFFWLGEPVNKDDGFLKLCA